MIACLIAATVAQQSLYQQVIKKPTFNNGYEEYVQAADIALSVRLRELCDAVTAPDAKGTLIERQRAVANQCGRILALIKQGNTKPVSYPNEMDENTLLPELQYFRSIGPALAIKAQVDFAEGRVNQGFNTLLETISFGERISFVGPLIFDLVGRTICIPAWRAIGENLALVSLPTAWEMQRTAEKLQLPNNAWSTSVRTELENFASTIPEKLTDADSRKLIGIDEEIGTSLASVSKERLRAIVKELEFAFNRHYTELLKVTDLPERQWIPATSKVTGQAKPQDPIALQIFDSLVPNTTRVVLYELVRRTHLRLLRVVGAVVEFKWTNGYYPGALTQLRDPSIAQDPLTGAEFAYQRVPGSFTVFSEGTEDTGKIGLDWTAPAR